MGYHTCAWQEDFKMNCFAVSVFLALVLCTVSVPVNIHDVDENKDHIPDYLDLNRDGKLDHPALRIVHAAPIAHPVKSISYAAPIVAHPVKSVKSISHAAPIIAHPVKSVKSISHAAPIIAQPLRVVHAVQPSKSV